MKLNPNIVIFGLTIALVAVLAALWEPPQPISRLTPLEAQKRAVYRELAQETGTTPGLVEPTFGWGNTGLTGQASP